MTMVPDNDSFFALRGAILSRIRTRNQPPVTRRVSDQAVGSADASVRDVTHLPETPWCPRAHPRRSPLLWVILVGLAVVAAVRYELETSALQSRVLSAWASRLSYTVEPGASPRIVFPKGGPSDERLGFTRVPVFSERLEAAGFHVVQQAVFSPPLERLAAWGIPPPYVEPMAAGLVIRDLTDSVLYDASFRDRKFERFEDIPPLVVRALLFIEDRDLSDPPDPRSNPAVNWVRFAKAGLLYGGSKLGLSVHVEGGSTLATQMEKYRHSANGFTRSGLEKIKQMTSASLQAYRDGADTHAERRAIVLAFLNTMPLGATRNHGEVIGLGDGLREWFGLQLRDVRDALGETVSPDVRARVFKHVLALLCAVRAPTHYFLRDRAALEARVDAYTGLLESAGLIGEELGRWMRRTPIVFSAPRSQPVAPQVHQGKAVDALRVDLMQLLQERGLYDLDRLDLDVKTTVDGALQKEAALLFQHLRDPDFVRVQGLRGERLLSQGDPASVIYGLMLFEATPEANLLRARVDSLDAPFNVNDGMKLELGSTAKLRTLAHYLEVLAILHKEFAGVDAHTLQQEARAARDPITRWAAQLLARKPGVDLPSLLNLGLDRKYSAAPGAFFTGRGRHTFQNFDRDDNHRILTVREAAIRSTNLVFIRLMRDLVRFHQARLAYDARAVLAQPEHPVRIRLLRKISRQEGLRSLARAYREFRGLSTDAVVARLLGGDRAAPRRLAILFFAWNPAGGEEALSRWLKERGAVASPQEVQRLDRVYGRPELTLLDYAFLLHRDPLDVWTAGKVAASSGIRWSELEAGSTDARRVALSWLFRTRNRHAQNVRLRWRIEQDAFTRMTPYWRRLGFPFQRLVPSYATAIGSSGDRPSALAELMGIIVNDGLRRPSLAFRELCFGCGTPYHTLFEADSVAGERVMAAPIASALRQVLEGVVERGTAGRIRGVFVDAEMRPVTVGGKTGSGDNRFDTFGRHGGKLASRPVSRTATFVFFVGDRYYGVITATVPDMRAKDYRFTSALPLAVLKLLAPEINQRLAARLPHAETS
jgi:membrane peptidoglycan carboxypeptidase